MRSQGETGEDVHGWVRFSKQAVQLPMSIELCDRCSYQNILTADSSGTFEPLLFTSMTPYLEDMGTRTQQPNRVKEREMTAISDRHSSKWWR